MIMTSTAPDCLTDNMPVVQQPHSKQPNGRSTVETTSKDGSEWALWVVVGIELSVIAILLSFRQQQREHVNAPTPPMLQ